MLTLPLSLFDMDSKPLKTLVRGPLGGLLSPRNPVLPGTPLLKSSVGC